ncbi:MAG TPA: phosphoribosyl-ATP diphosphatase [Acidimicrobiales bacterium]|nr:phosphoribosyl-ATP diphosphatase [Acidimicrobiales bacterium]
MSTISELEAVLRQRDADRPAGSYTATLLADRERLQRKIMEEAFETCLELGRAEVDDARVVSEAADLLYHLIVGLVACGLSLDDVIAELGRRRT